MHRLKCESKIFGLELLDPQWGTPNVVVLKGERVEQGRSQF